MQFLKHEFGKEKNGPRKWMEYITLLEVREGGFGDLTEGLSVSSTRKISITDPNWSSDYPVHEE